MDKINQLSEIKKLKMLLNAYWKNLIDTLIKALSQQEHGHRMEGY